MKYVLPALLGLLVAAPAFACPPAAAFVGGGMSYAPATVFRQRTVYIQQAPVVCRQLAVVQADPVYDPCPAQVQQAPVYQQPQYVPMTYADPGVSFAPAYAPSCNYGVGRSLLSQRQVFVQRDFTPDYGGRSAGFALRRTAIRQRSLVPAPVFEERTVARTRMVTRSR